MSAVGTGLPDIPKGYRWSVQDHRIGRAMGLLVALEQAYVLNWTRYEDGGFLVGKRRIPMSETRWRSVAEEAVDGINAIAVHNAAHKVMKKFKTEQLRESLRGVYPPKTLPAPSPARSELEKYKRAHGLLADWVAVSQAISDAPSSGDFDRGLTAGYKRIVEFLERELDK